MYKGKKSWYFLIFAILLFCLYLYAIIYLSIQSNLEVSPLIKSIILPFCFLFFLFRCIKTSAIKITINNDSIHFKTLFRKGKVQFNSIISVNFPNDRKIEIFEKDRKIIIPLELQNSSLFLKEFRTKYSKSDNSLNQDQYYHILKKRAFKDHQNNRINLHLWKPIILTLILLYIVPLLIDLTTPFNIFRIIFLLILPITTFFLPEVIFAYNIEKKANDEDDILTRNYDFERNLYIKYFLYGLLTLIVLTGSFWVI